MDIFNYYSDTLTSAAGEDLLTQIETAIDDSPILVREITMIATSAFTFKTNGQAWANSVYEDADTKHKVSLTNVGLTSVIIVEDAIDIFIAILF